MLRCGARVRHENFNDHWLITGRSTAHCHLARTLECRLTTVCALVDGRPRWLGLRSNITHQRKSKSWSNTRFLWPSRRRRPVATASLQPSPGTKCHTRKGEQPWIRPARTRKESDVTNIRVHRAVILARSSREWSATYLGFAIFLPPKLRRLRTTQHENSHQHSICAKPSLSLVPCHFLSMYPPLPPIYPHVCMCVNGDGDGSVASLVPVAQQPQLNSGKEQQSHHIPPPGAHVWNVVSIHSRASRLYTCPKQWRRLMADGRRPR